MFGCSSQQQTVDLKMEPLCDNTTIDSGGNKDNIIFVFRGGKFWQFDNKPQNGKPLGNVVKGNIYADKLWDGIHFPAGIGYNGQNLLAIYDKTCQQWAPKEEDTTDEDPHEFEEPCPPTAVSLPNQRVAIINGNKVWIFGIPIFLIN